MQHTLTSNNLATLATYFNAKIDFVVVSLHEQMKMIYYTVVNQICHLHYETLRNKIAIASKHPDLAGRLLVDKPGTYGMVAGEVLYFYTCDEVHVIVRQTTQCTQEMPVSYKNQLPRLVVYWLKQLRQYHVLT